MSTKQTRLIWQLAAGMAALSCGCVGREAQSPPPSAGIAAATTNRPMVASVEPVPLPRLDPPAAQSTVAAADDESMSAGALLKKAFDLFKEDQNQRAADTFRAAVATGNLNDAGRALAYWHIYVSEQSLGHSDRAADALEGFVVVAQDVIAMREQLRYAEDESGDFVDRFDLKHRLARARAILSAEWATHSARFGRTESQPVPVHNRTEKDYFLEMAAPCGRPKDRHVVRADEPERNVEHVSVSCDGVAGQDNYFFQTVPEASDD